jgi:hypothetical protein
VADTGVSGEKETSVRSDGAQEAADADGATRWRQLGRLGAFLVGLLSAAGAATAVYLAVLRPPTVVSARLGVAWIEPQVRLKYALAKQGNLARFEVKAPRRLTPDEVACTLKLTGALVYYR